MTRQEQTNKENREHCKHIADNLELFADGNGYKCPHCGEVHEMTAYEETEHENESGETCYTCPNCSEEIEESELEAVLLYWWTDYAEYPLTSSTCEAIDQYFEELFNC